MADGSRAFESVARGVTVPNAQSGQSGPANVNPIHTWVRLAQRIPVRVPIDYAPPGVGRTMPDAEAPPTDAQWASIADLVPDAQPGIPAPQSEMGSAK
jgi:multidrug resistance efflux pump